MKGPRYPVDRFPVPVGIRALIEKGATATALAAIVGIDHSAMNRKVRGQCQFNVADLLKIAERIGCKPGDLFDTAIARNELHPSLLPVRTKLAA